jgi:zinc carboxypeptidase
MKYLLLVLLIPITICAKANKSDSSKPRIQYVNTAFENACPANWEIGPGDSLTVSLVYDYERSSPNRSNSHWHYQVQAEKGMDIIVTMQNFKNIWNGVLADPISDRSMCYVSANGKDWKAIATEKIEGTRLRFKLHMDADRMYLASVEPYDVSDVEKLLSEIRKNPLVKVTNIGKTVEGRNLEIVKIGDENAPNRVLIRVRAHGFEAGGNWTAQGLIRSLLDGSKDSKEYLKRYCLYIMPMANKDAVARGKSRFNAMGVDLNRNWQKPADPATAPENYALEEWLKKMIAAGKKPDLLLDLHNDGGGNLHIARPDVDLSAYLEKMKKLEMLLRKHTWFTEGSTSPEFKNPGAINGGLLERYGIYGAVYELNYEWIEGLKKHPFGKDWEGLGNKLRKVLYEYFDNNG